MVLSIDGHICPKNYSLDNLAEHPELTQFSIQFASSTEFKQPAEEVSKTVYVHQREFAVLSKADPHGLQFIGSDDATTCHILILDNQAAVALGHLDGGRTRESIEAMLDELQRYAPQNTNYDVYLAGGFLDQSDRQHSRKLSNEVLQTFSDMPKVSFHLKLAAITTYNDHLINNVHYPMIYGLSFDINTKSLRKMNFTDYGPALRLRTVYLSVNEHCAWCIYSSLNGRIILNKFSIDRNIIDQYYRRLHKYYFHDEQRLLALTSTSPEQERPSYTQNMKKNILYILKFYKDIPQWFDKQTHSIIYYRSNDQWKTDNPAVVEEIEIE